jgi:hypothetical protein
MLRRYESVRRLAVPLERKASQDTCKYHTVRSANHLPGMPMDDSAAGDLHEFGSLVEILQPHG